MKRLIKGEFFTGYKKDENNYFEIFKNPTSMEITKIVNFDKENSIRGVIEENGDIYAWGGELLHRYVIKDVNINGFRFAIDGIAWFIDSHGKYTKDEIIDLINEYKNKLSQFGDINLDWEIIALKDIGNNDDEYLFKSNEIFNKSLVSRLARNREMFEVNMSPLSPLYPGYYVENKEEEIEEGDENE